MRVSSKTMGWEFLPAGSEIHFINEQTEWNDKRVVLGLPLQWLSRFSSNHNIRVFDKVLCEEWGDAMYGETYPFRSQDAYTFFDCAEEVIVEVVKERLRQEFAAAEAVLATDKKDKKKGIQMKTLEEVFLQQKRVNMMLHYNERRNEIEIHGSRSNKRTLVAEKFGVMLSNGQLAIPESHKIKDIYKFCADIGCVFSQEFMYEYMRQTEWEMVAKKEKKGGVCDGCID